MAAVQRLSWGIQRSSTIVAAALALLVVAPTPASHAQVVYGVDAIGRATLDGSGVEQSFIPTSHYSTGVAVDADHVYWAGYDSSTTPGSYSIGRANLDGSGVEPRFISLATQPEDVAVDGEHVYWAQRFGSSYSIGRADLDGTDVDESFIITGTYLLTAVAVDSNHVYWTSLTPYAIEPTSSIGRANLDGSGVEQSLIKTSSYSFGLAVDADHVYWTHQGNGTIGRANLDGSSVDQGFLTELGGVLGVAVDTNHIYWTTRRRSIGNEPPQDWVGTIGRANLDGSAAERSFISSESHMVDAAADGGHVYWVNQAEYQPCLHCEPPPDDTHQPHHPRRSSSRTTCPTRSTGPGSGSSSPQRTSKRVSNAGSTRRVGDRAFRRKPSGT